MLTDPSGVGTQGRRREKSRFLLNDSALAQCSDPGRCQKHTSGHCVPCWNLPAMFLDMGVGCSFLSQLLVSWKDFFKNDIPSVSSTSGHKDFYTLDISCRLLPQCRQLLPAYGPQARSVCQPPADCASLTPDAEATAPCSPGVGDPCHKASLSLKLKDSKAEIED